VCLAWSACDAGIESPPGLRRPCWSAPGSLTSESVMPTHRVLPGLLAALLLIPLAGCQYHLQGVVLEAPGGPPTLSVVDSDDSRLSQEGLASATTDLTIDPEAHQPHAMSTERADGKGKFSIPITEAGAGMLIYNVEVVVRAEGHQAMSETI